MPTQKIESNITTSNTDQISTGSVRDFVIKIATDDANTRLDSDPILQPLNLYPGNLTWPKRTFDNVKQRWTGVVESIEKDKVTVRLKDIDNKNAPEEIAILLTEDISDDEREFLAVGASFIWTIGRQEGESQLFSKIAFRRLPVWTKEDIEEAEQWGKETFEKVHDTKNSTIP